MSRHNTHAKRTLLVAATGGHLEQLYRLRRRFVPRDEHVEWATFDEPQSRSLLSHEFVHHMRYVAPRGYGSVAANLPSAAQILRRGNFDRVVSTGSGIALAFLPLARTLGIPCHYIESAARAEGPSLTGSLVSRIPGINLYTQYESWADQRWHLGGSLFDGYLPKRNLLDSPAVAQRVVVTLGTMRTYGFRRAVARLVKVLPQVLGPDAEVLWQVGVTDTSGLGIDSQPSVPHRELKAAIGAADLVIAHAGIGSALTALDLGKCPILLPRRQMHDEHVDDHQLMIAGELDRRGLALSRDPDLLCVDDLREAMALSVENVEQPAAFILSR